MFGKARIKENALNSFGATIGISKAEKEKLKKSVRIKGRRKYLDSPLSLSEAYELLGMNKYTPALAHTYYEEAVKKAGNDTCLKQDLIEAKRLITTFYFINPFEA
jgi:hypothetical protein